jgi:hypothetical protein
MAYDSVGNYEWFCLFNCTFGLSVFEIKMKNQVHILNGDSLKINFPKDLFGDKIVFRECLIDGNILGENFEVFFTNRANYIHSIIEEKNKINYKEYTLKEFYKVNKIDDIVEINLWFEDDLFCQTNLWFVLFYLKEKKFQNNIYLVRPKITSPYSFGNMSSDELINSYNKRTNIDKKSWQYFSELWKAYQQNNFNELIEIGNKLNTFSSFLIPVINAQIDRFNKTSLGRPKQTLLNIKKEFKTTDFNVICKEFNKREAIYGFGDLQIKLMLNELEK